MPQNNWLQILSGNIDSLLKCYSSLDKVTLLDECEKYRAQHKYVYVKVNHKRKICELEDVFADTRFAKLSPHERICMLGSLRKCGWDCEYLYRQMERAKIEHGTAVGVIAAQSISEQLTQTTLNQFHLAGAKKSLSGGMKRLNELFEVSSSLSMPYISGIDNPTDALMDQSYQYTADQGGIKYVDGVYKIEFKVGDKTILIDKRDEDEDDEDDDEEDEVDEEEEKKKKKKKKKTKKKIKVSEEKEEQDLFEIKQQYDRELVRYRDGLPGVIELDEEDGMVFLSPSDYNIKKLSNVIHDVLLRESPGSLLTYVVHDVQYIAATLGIAAAEDFLVKEIMETLGAEGIHVNIRHVSMMVANMTFSGKTLPNTMNGVKTEKMVLLRASFQQATEILAEAASKGLEDTLSDPSAQLMTGKKPQVGTELVYLVDEQPYEVPYAPMEESEEENDLGGEQEYIPCDSPVEASSSDDEWMMPVISLEF